jgi:hypothetical protein
MPSTNPKVQSTTTTPQVNEPLRVQLVDEQGVLKAELVIEQGFRVLVDRAGAVIATPLVIPPVP